MRYGMCSKFRTPKTVMEWQCILPWDYLLASNWEFSRHAMRNYPILHVFVPPWGNPSEPLLVLKYFMSLNMPTLGFTSSYFWFVWRMEALLWKGLDNFDENLFFLQESSFALCSTHVHDWHVCVTVSVSITGQYNFNWRVMMHFICLRYALFVFC